MRVEIILLTFSGSFNQVLAVRRAESQSANRKKKKNQCLIHLQARLKCGICGLLSLFFNELYILKILSKNKGSFPKCHITEGQMSYFCSNILASHTSTASEASAYYQKNENNSVLLSWTLYAVQIMQFWERFIETGVCSENSNLCTLLIVYEHQGGESII